MLFDTSKFYPQVQNVGLLPLTITDIRTADGPGKEEYFVSFGQPVVLQPGEVHLFSPTFRFSGPGLRPGAFEIISDDPHTPIFRQPVVGTGLVADNLDHGHDFVAVESIFRGVFDNTPVLRTRSDAGGNWEFFLEPEFVFHTATFDPVSGLIAHGSERTNLSGQRTVFNIGAFGPSYYQDTDGDGLPDDVEFAVGTAVDRMDSDGDGLGDFAELSQGLNPLDDRPAITGVIAALSFPTGQASDIKLAASGNQQLAYVATVEGLAIVDTTRFDQPLLLGQLNLPGSSSVAIDSSRGIAAVAAPSNSQLHIVDVADPVQPKLVLTIPVAASHVELFDGRIYAAVGSDIRVYDLASGDEVGDFSLGTGQSIDAMARDGALLVVLVIDATRIQSLRVLDLSGPSITGRGSIAMADQYRGTSLFVADGVVWITALKAATGGLITVGLSDPDLPQLISNPDRTDILGAAIALNGSGLGIVVGGSTQIAGDDLLLLDTRFPANTGSLFAALALSPDGIISPRELVIASGLAYVVDGKFGLQVVNYLAFDQGKTAPEMTLRVLNTDIDPSRPGIQMFETSSVTLSALIRDDVQVRNAELLMDGVIVRNEVTYPYDFTTTLPTIRQSGSEAVLQFAPPIPAGMSAFRTRS